MALLIQRAPGVVNDGRGMCADRFRGLWDTLRHPHSVPMASEMNRPRTRTSLHLGRCCQWTHPLVKGSKVSAGEEPPSPPLSQMLLPLHPGKASFPLFWRLERSHRHSSSLSSAEATRLDLPGSVLHSDLSSRLFWILANVQDH